MGSSTRSGGVMSTTGRKNRSGPGRRLMRLCVAAPLLMVSTIPLVPAGAIHLDQTPSAAIYRIPYADGSLVDVSRDAHNHGACPASGCDRIDMVAYDDNMGTRTSPTSGPAVAGDGTAFIVAAASGTIAVIQDDHGDDYGRGDGVAADGVTSQNDALEHSCQDTEDTNGNGMLDLGEDIDGDGNLDTTVANLVVVGTCQQHNNYVWIAHPNGEWTKYSHFRTGTVTTDQGWAAGDLVQVGQVLGEEGDVGRAGGTHLHFEVAQLGPYDSYDTDGNGIVVNEDADGDGVLDPGEDADGDAILDVELLPANIGNPGGFISGAFVNHEPQVCDATTANYAYVDDNDNTTTLTAGDCVNTAPVAEAGGPYTIDEGATDTLDGTASSDPHNAVLTYSWSPAANLDDPTSPTPVYDATGLDDSVEALTLTVDDQGGDVSAAEALTDTDLATVTILNVAPEVTAVGDSIVEGGTATVGAIVEDPGTLDTHTASIDWGDGTPVQPVTRAQVEAGVEHPYGDNGVYSVTVTVTDDDGGVGSDTVSVTVGNLDPEVTLDVSGQVSFPGGDYFVAGVGDQLPLSAEGTDAGSDDLTFAWSTGDATTYFNDSDGVPDPLPSPLGTYPFAAADAIGAVSPSPGAELVSLTLSDDDGGSAVTDAGVIVTGTAETSEPIGWWKHQYSGSGAPHIDPATAAGYLAIVNAVSSVFSEAVVASSAEEAHAVLSPAGGDQRARAGAALLVSWLQFASGAVAHDATVPLPGGSTVGFLELMFSAEATILDAESTAAQLLDLIRDLDRVLHAG